MKKSDNAQPDGRGSLLLAAAGFTAIAIYVRSRRQAERSYARLSSEIEGKVDGGELTDEQAFSLMANERRESAARQGYRSVAAFVMAVGMPMSKGHSPA